MTDILSNPVIAAVRSSLDFSNALSSPVEAVFLLKTSILTAEKCIAEAKKENKRVFVHMDLAEGIGKDRDGVIYISSLGANGIISTKSSLIKCAHEVSLLCVQRVFCVDSQSIENIGELTAHCRPDFIELMPGVAPKTVARVSKMTDIPIIAGGLIDEKSEIISALNAGAYAISTGKRELWYT